MKYDNISVNDVRDIIQKLSKDINYNCISLWIHDLTSKNYEIIKKYIICYNTAIEKYDLLKIDEYITNILNIFDFNQKFDSITIEPLHIDKKFDTLSIKYVGNNINNYIFFKHLAEDIKMELEKHMIEIYFEQHHPEIDIYDEQDKDIYANIIDNLNINTLYETYNKVSISVPLMIPKHDMVIYLESVMLTSIDIIKIYNEIILCFNDLDMKEIYEYNKNEFIYKYDNKLNIKQFNLVTNSIDY